jgi:hypothetical protein
VRELAAGFDVVDVKDHSVVLWSSPAATASVAIALKDFHPSIAPFGGDQKFLVPIYLGLDLIKRFGVKIYFGPFKILNTNSEIISPQFVVFYQIEFVIGEFIYTAPNSGISW